MYKRASGRIGSLAAVAVLALSAACGGSVSVGGAGGDADFTGEEITLLVPFSPGGGYDSYARLVAPYLEKQLDATVVVENRPGAGGLLAINNLVAAEPDGLTLAIMNGLGAGGAAIAGASGAQFELDQLSYVGDPGSGPEVFTVGGHTPYRTIEDVVESRGFRFGSTGPGAADYLNANVLITAFGLQDAKVVTGFPGSSENELAVARGDVDGMTGDYQSLLPSIESGDHRLMLLLHRERNEELPETSTVLEAPFPNPDGRELMGHHLNLLEIRRPIVAPPGMDEERLEVLRNALRQAINDPGLREKAKEQGLEINYTSGEQVDRIVAKLLKAPQTYRDVLVRAYARG